MSPTPREFWAKAPIGLITDGSLTLAAIRVYLWIDVKAGSRGWWVGRQSDIAAGVGVTERSVHRALCLLGRYLDTDRARKHGMTRYLIRARQTGSALPLLEPDFEVSDRTPASGVTGTSDRTPASGYTGQPRPVLAQRTLLRIKDPEGKDPDPERAHTRAWDQDEETDQEVIVGWTG